MIKNLSGVYETVDYQQNRSIVLYKNRESENYPIHWHNAVEIIMPLENTYDAKVGQNSFHLEEFDVLIIPPGELHELIAPPSGKRMIFLCSFSFFNNAPALSSLVPALTSTSYISARGGSLHKELSTLFQKMCQEYNENDVLTEAIIYNRLIEILIMLRRHNINSNNPFEESSSGKQKEYLEKLGRVTAYINENFNENITLDLLADIAGYSKFHFSRMFKLYTNLTFTDYINQVRIKAAESLLFDPNLAITEIAMRSGFSSITTFNRTFKEVKNCTPSEFKRLYRTRNNEAKNDIF